MACSPSLGLLLHRAARSAGLACATAHPDGCRDEPVPEEAIPVQRQADVIPPGQSAWDASDGAHPDVAADVALPRRRALADADAGKLAGRARDVQASGVRSLDEPRSEHLAAAEAVRDAAAELCIPGAARSAARSCVAPEVWAQPEPPKLEEPRDAAQPESAAQPRLQRSETQVLPAAQLPLAGQSPGAEASQREVRTAQPEQSVFPQSTGPQPQAAQQPAEPRG